MHRRNPDEFADCQMHHGDMATEISEEMQGSRESESKHLLCLIGENTFTNVAP